MTLNKTIAVLGSGPAGLLAAHAVGMAGHPVAVISLGEPSVLGGAQFLHEAIPMLTPPDPDVTITYRVRGNAETYMRKVYGDSKPPFVSFDHVKDGMEQGVWNLTGLYARLWDQWQRSINVETVSPEWLEGKGSEFALVISSVPLPSICRSPEAHAFTSQPVSIHDECLEQVPPNTIIYDGTEDRSWSRSSNLFGVQGTEWGGGRKPPFPNLQTVRKPIKTTCDCWPEVLRVGRFGTWRKGVLVNQAFTETIRELHKRSLLNLPAR